MHNKETIQKPLNFIKLKSASVTVSGDKMEQVCLQWHWATALRQIRTREMFVTQWHLKLHDKNGCQFKKSQMMSFSMSCNSQFKTSSVMTTDELFPEHSSNSCQIPFMVSSTTHTCHSQDQTLVASSIPGPITLVTRSLIPWHYINFLLTYLREHSADLETEVSRLRVPEYETVCPCHRDSLTLSVNSSNDF